MMELAKAFKLRLLREQSFTQVVRGVWSYLATQSSNVSSAFGSWFSLSMGIDYFSNDGVSCRSKFLSLWFESRPSHTTSYT